jgi:uncharacterized protein (TIGR00369 family)
MVDAQPIRRRSIEWHDPQEAARLGQGMSGLDYLHAMREGRLPPPPIMALLGFELTAVEPGRVVMELDPGEYHYNPIGSVHGGVAATVLDSVMGCAVLSTCPQGRGFTTLELKVNYLRGLSVGSGRLRAEGLLLSGGRRVAVAEARLTDGKGRLCVHATSTCLILALDEAG